MCWCAKVLREVSRFTAVVAAVIALRAPLALAQGDAPANYSIIYSDNRLTVTDQLSNRVLISPARFPSIEAYDTDLHPTINVDNLDPECTLRNLVLNEPKTIDKVDVILNNSSGMLGINSVVIVKRYGA